MVPDEVVARIDACLPQTQCTRCGYPGCRAYAEAIAGSVADFNRCPPGGDTTLTALAALLDRPVKPLDPSVGAPRPRLRAVVDETRCIGCRKCLDVCPVDAIVGARRRMHTVIAWLCTGCELCLPPCPIDCIELVPAENTGSGPWPDYAEAEAAEWRARAAARRRRLAARTRARRGYARAGEPRLAEIPPPERIRSDLKAALARAREKRASARRQGNV